MHVTIMHVIMLGTLILTNILKATYMLLRTNALDSA